MEQNITLFILSLSFVGILVLLYILLFKTPTADNRYLPMSENLDPGIKKIVKIFGPDIIALTPKEYFAKAQKDTKTELLIRKSGNPWDISVNEFYLIKMTLFGVGLLVGIGLAFLVSQIMPIWIAILMPFIVALLAFLYPNSYHEQLASKRELEFKKTLPEAIDLLRMALAGGNLTLINAIEAVTPHLDDSPIKEEFKQIKSDVDSGMSINGALINFSNRVPTFGIQSFVRALANANTKSVDMRLILESRSKESRKEINAEAEKAIAILPQKTMIVLGPASAFAVIMIAAAPAVNVLLQTLR